jgi:hypothetical protein
MADAATLEQAKGLPPDKVREIDALNLDAHQRETLECVLIAIPALTVQGALSELRAFGGI